MCERAERASFETLRNFFSLLCISLCTMIFERYSQNLWGPLFVGAPGQLPTLPSPKSGPGWGHTFMALFARILSPCTLFFPSDQTLSGQEYMRSYKLTLPTLPALNFTRILPEFCLKLSRIITLEKMLRTHSASCLTTPSRPIRLWEQTRFTCSFE